LATFKRSQCPLQGAFEARLVSGAFDANIVLIENKASGIQLIQELIADRVRGITKYEPDCDKTMRMHAQTALIESGFVHLPRDAPWLADYLHELVTFAKARHDDRIDSTAQALDWIKHSQLNSAAGWIEHFRRLPEEARGGLQTAASERESDVRMRAPRPHENYYLCGINGRGGRYSSDANGIIENVHPKDVGSMSIACCAMVVLGLSHFA
jgi:hypothetical protein